MPKPVPPRGARENLQLLPDPEHNLSVEEVKLLWSFLHGDIMIGGIRHRLREHWGLCARHAWGHAVVEIELWQAGAGLRAGHQPFDVAILYEDLLESMIEKLAGTRSRARMKMLAGQGACPVCKDLHMEGVPGLSGGYANSDSSALARETNEMVHVRAWVAETRPLWRVCPACSAAARTDEAPDAPVCRLHLLQRGSLDDEETRRLLSDLTHERSLLLTLIDSMTQAGRPSTPEADASWIQVMGWFNGWAFPMSLLADGPGQDDSP